MVAVDEVDSKDVPRFSAKAPATTNLQPPAGLKKVSSAVSPRKAAMSWKHTVKGTRPSRQLIALYINIVKLINDKNVVFC